MGVQIQVKPRSGDGGFVHVSLKESGLTACVDSLGLKSGFIAKTFLSAISGLTDAIVQPMV